MTLDDEEVHAVNRAQLALRLHKTTDEIDAAPLEGMWDVLGVMEFDADERRKANERLKF